MYQVDVFFEGHFWRATVAVGDKTIRLGRHGSVTLIPSAMFNALRLPALNGGVVSHIGSYAFSITTIQEGLRNDDRRTSLPLPAQRECAASPY